ncbi:glucoamylase family protein [Cyclobacterium sp. 1_MG-2023]|uniref:glucoamylase family protein n=1 Tax=Cyclobacterium sp. 1_MG-2023 TaxID=3062681 RepID=UPI0026E24B54|nr:glucoamylase family protein [Cyclobacterium sp. 1_MG-2023]MDO6436957.1 glucoamylase family protein [Cyclobacterium sp. 1_MG-2023]
MSRIICCFLFLILSFSCQEETVEQPILQVTKVMAGSLVLSQDYDQNSGIEINESITIYFSSAVDRVNLEESIQLKEKESGQSVNFNLNFFSENKEVRIQIIGLMKPGTTYVLEIEQRLNGSMEGLFLGYSVNYTTKSAASSLMDFEIQGAKWIGNRRWANASVSFSLKLTFSKPTALTLEHLELTQDGVSKELLLKAGDDGASWLVKSANKLRDFEKHTFTIRDLAQPDESKALEAFTLEFYTGKSEENKFPALDDAALLTLIQEQTFKYFWDFAHPHSGMIRERNTSGDLVTTGGTGFGMMALIVGVERGFISRSEGVERWRKVVDFLSKADRFHGVWPHWLNGNTGQVIPFSPKDDGGDLVETALLIQGLLTVKEYLDPNNTKENEIIVQINELWEEVEWDWYTQGGQNKLFWHWSPNHAWDMNLPVTGYNEALIVYVLAAASPTHAIDAEVYHQGWSRSGAIANGNTYFDQTLPLGPEMGGPLFYSHYSFLGLDPRTFQDQYANYWDQNVSHSKIHRAYAVQNSLGYVGYGAEMWGLTASDNQAGYAAHSPTNDLGVVTPTAALSSMPYTPEASMEALKLYYYSLGDRLWGEYGFYDAFNLTEGWFADSYLAIDQGPIIIMIENHRSGLLWNQFMKNEQVKEGLDMLGFTY